MLRTHQAASAARTDRAARSPGCWPRAAPRAAPGWPPRHWRGKPVPGREIHAKIWIGSAVNGENGPSGTKGTYVSAPITISGAASPMARDTARISPVSSPGQRRRQDVVPHRLPLGRAEGERRLAQRQGHGTQRLAGGQDHQRQHQQGERRGTGQQRPLEAQRAHEQAQAEQAVDDRRHASQVRDVDLDQARPSSTPAILLERNRGTDADGHGEQGRQSDEPDAAGQRGQQARVRGTARRIAGHEGPREPARAVARDVPQQQAQRRQRRQPARPRPMRMEGAIAPTQRRSSRRSAACGAATSRCTG